MPVFSYKAVDQRGRQVAGVLPAVDENNLEEKLKGAGVWLIAAIPQRPKPAAKRSEGGWLTRRGGVRRRDLIDFCTLMAFQTKVGIPMIQALAVASQDCENAAFRVVLQSLSRHIESGLTLHESLEKFPAIFSAHITSVVRAGEMSSKLPETFEDLRGYLEWVEQVLADVRQASLYPAIVLTVVSGFVLFLFTAIIPKFADLLHSVNVPLPLLTRVIFGVSGFVRETWWIWLLLLLLLTAGTAIGRRASKRVAYFLDQTKLKLPIFGHLNWMLSISRFTHNLAILNWMLSISRFTHNLAILYRSGINILQSLNLCRGLVGNLVVEEAVEGVEEAVKTGSVISEAMRRYPIFPPLLLRMVVMGETTGNLDHALENVADYYNHVIPRKIKKVFTVLEPAMMLGLIFMVGAVALSIYVPILSLMSAIK